MILPIAILAGGLATRLRPVSDDIPKSLIDIAGRPFIEYQLALIARNGIREVVLCIGHLGSQIERHLGDGSRFGLKLRYVDDGPDLVGTGGALKRALPYLGDSFLVMYGDSYLDCNYTEIAATFIRSARQGLMTVFRNDNKWERSNVRFHDGEIVAYDKKASDATFRHIDYGLGALKRSAVERLVPAGKYDLADLYQTLVVEKELAGFEVPDRFYEIGSPSGLTELRTVLSGRQS